MKSDGEGDSPFDPAEPKQDSAGGLAGADLVDKAEDKEKKVSCTLCREAKVR